MVDSLLVNLNPLIREEKVENSNKSEAATGGRKVAFINCVTHNADSCVCVLFIVAIGVISSGQHSAVSESRCDATCQPSACVMAETQLHTSCQTVCVCVCVFGC